MSWWDAAYRSGHVNWDPGPYDGHLPWLIESYAIDPCAAIDLGCGTGKSAIWLARHGFEATGVDLSPTAIDIARRTWTLSAENRQGSSRRSGSCRFLAGSYPDDFSDEQLPADSFGLVVERGFLQHFSEGAALQAMLERTRRIMRPSGIFYSLITAREGANGFWGPRRWSREEIRQALQDTFSIVEMKKSVFTPGEEGSIPAWAVVMRKSR